MHTAPINPFSASMNTNLKGKNFQCISQKITPTKSPKRLSFPYTLTCKIVLKQNFKISYRHIDFKYKYTVSLKHEANNKYDKFATLVIINQIMDSNTGNIVQGNFHFYNSK